LAGVDGGRFRRVKDGYDPAEVDALIAEREARMVRLEAEAQEMARRVIETEERMQTLLHERDEAAADTTGPIAKLEEVYGQARRQATRIRMKALEDAVQIADRVTELSKMRDDLGSRVSEVAEKAGISFGDEKRPPVGMAPVGARPLDGIYVGPVRIDFGPLADFAQLTAFEDAVREIPAARNISVQRFSGGRATLAMSLEAPTELLSELKERAPFDLRQREANGEGLVLDVVGETAADAGEEPGFAQRPAAEHGAEEQTSTYTVQRPETVLDEPGRNAA
jgi:hypothetical protein